MNIILVISSCQIPNAVKSWIWNKILHKIQNKQTKETIQQQQDPTEFSLCLSCELFGFFWFCFVLIHHPISHYTHALLSASSSFQTSFFSYPKRRLRGRLMFFRKRLREIFLKWHHFTWASLNCCYPTSHSCFFSDVSLGNIQGLGKAQLQDFMSNA